VTLSILIEQLVNGLTLGAIYALVALGYTLVYGVLMMINFAHSEIFMLGALSGWSVFALFPTLSGPWAAVAVVTAGAAGGGLAALLLQRVAYAQLKRSARLTPLISAVGASLFLQNLVFLWRDNQLSFPALFPVTTWTVGPCRVSSLQLAIIGTAVALMLALTFFIKKTRWGKALRSVAHDADAAALMGIPVGVVIASTFFIGGLLGGAAGVMNGFYYGSVKYNMGFLPGIKAFTAAVLGGIGSLPGAMLGGLLLGLLEALGAGFLPEPEWKDVFAFVVLIIVLLIRPSGILGESTSEKV
jgi:branched-chain amino acid transport system permease protein